MPTRERKSPTAASYAEAVAGTIGTVAAIAEALGIEEHLASCDLTHMLKLRLLTVDEAGRYALAEGVKSHANA